MAGGREEASTETLRGRTARYNQAVQQADRYRWLFRRERRTLGTEERVAAASRSGYGVAGATAQASAGAPIRPTGWRYRPGQANCAKGRIPRTPSRTGWSSARHSSGCARRIRGSVKM